MRRARRCAAALALALAGAGGAAAQSVNVDVYEPTFGAVPSSSYGAAGAAGVWNAVQLGATQQPLVGLAGAPTGVTITLDPGFTWPLYYDNANTLGDDGALLDDVVWTPGGPCFITFQGLASGTYRVLTYAMAPDAKTSYATDVDVLGSLDGTQTVGGATFQGHAPGVSYAAHTVDVTGGTLTVQVAVGYVFLSLNGLQLELLGPPGASYCAGDGSGAACPCGNPGGPGEGCANGTGSGARLAASGSASASADDLAFGATQLPPGQPALLFSANGAVNGGLGAIFGDGLRCAGGAVKRLRVAAADAGGAVDFGAGHAAAGGWSAGDARRFQAWYRDPQGSPCGAGFNLSDGYAVAFLP